MRLVTVLLALAPLAAIGACASTRPIEGAVRLGQTAAVSGPRVTPLRVIEDSRCPMNARCIQAGRVVVRARVVGGGWSKVVDLTLGQPVPIADGALTLAAVTPDRVAGKPLPAARLRFTFAFEGGL